MEEKQKLMENVVAQFQKTSSDSSGGAVLAHALSKFPEICAAGVQEWKERNAFSNADPNLRQHYDNNNDEQNDNNGSIEDGTIEPMDEEEEYDDEEDDAVFAEAQANRPPPLSEIDLNNNQTQVILQLTMDYALYQNDATSIVLYFF
jgi:hypothetical protein